MKLTDLQPRDQGVVVEMRKVILRHPDALALLVKMASEDSLTASLSSITDTLSASHKVVSSLSTALGEELRRRKAAKDQVCQ